MCKVPDGFGTRSVMRLAFASMTAALLAGCADSSRFMGDPLGNPFHSASNEPAPAGRDMAPPPPYRPARMASVQSQPLAPPSDMPSRAVANYQAPAHASPRLASNYNPPKTERTASIPAPSGHGAWSAQGGMAVVAANGETGGVLAQRYNVPLEALLHENGLSSASQIHPGLRMVIPVYSADGGATRVMAEAPVHKPHDHSSRERLLANRDTKVEAAHEQKLAAEHEQKLASEHAQKLAMMEHDRKLAAEHELRLAHDQKLAAEHTKKMAANDHEKSHWVKGPQPVADLHERDKAQKLAKGEDLKAQKLAKSEELKAKKIAKAEAAEQQRAEKKAAQVDVARAAPAVVREQPTKVAKLEDTSSKKAAVDPTPTASLPPAAAEKASLNGTPEFRWPAHGRIIQGFKSGGNDGINIAVPEGTSVKAAESGVVAYAGNEIKGFGNLVLIRHPNGYVTAYANNGDIDVKRGEQVKRGQTIAKSGQSGNVASPQLHFEVRKGSTPVDPTRYLAGL